jgi:hypothetical protein
LRFGDEPSPDRIQFRVAQRRPQMYFVQRAGIEAPLPGVPACPVNRVPICSVPAVSIPACQRKSIWQRRNGDQVDVILHQAIAQQGHVVGFDVLS